MRIAAVDLTDVLPVRRFKVDQLSEIVVIAGPNGVGKSRLVDGLLQKFQNPKSLPQTQIVLEATNTSEIAEWGKKRLDSSILADADILIRTLHRNRGRRQWNSSVIHFESDRSIQQITPYQFTWDITDPWLENLGWSQTFGGLRARFQDTLHSLFRKVQSHEKEIARKAIEMQRGGQASMPLDFADPLVAFKDAFALLVAPKKLLDPDPKKQQLFYEYEGNQFPLNSLSSGEREVVNIVFDFILRTSSDSIIFFDEPELHLHPELSYKLLQALRSTGTNNQFIFCTHSPDIITASLDQTVIFLAPPSKTPNGDYSNQAVPVKEDDSTNEALKLLGQSIGVVALGRRLVLIEGTTSSLDKQTYGLLLKNRFPNLVLVPTGGKDLIRSFAQIVEHVLDKAIWGVDFFMLCDRDSADHDEILALQTDAKQRLRFLDRYHLENYFLEPAIIAKMFEDLEPDGSWLRDPTRIEAKLREIALNSLSYATALITSARIRRRVGNVSIMTKGVHGLNVDELAAAIVGKANSELARVQTALMSSDVELMVRETFVKLQALIQDPSDRWKFEIPGKQILGQFSAATGMELARFKILYLATAAKGNSAVFSNVISIFADFSVAQTV
jgi:predicted ATPase